MLKKTIWEMGRDSVEEFRAKPKLPLVVVLDNVRSLNNIGSIFRTADAFRVERLCLCGITAAPPSPEIHKTALGAEDSVEWRHYASTLDCLGELRQQDYTICALEQVNGSLPLDRLHPRAAIVGCGSCPVLPPPPPRYAVVVGHEVQGVSQEVVDFADLCLEIPQEGTKHSLNVAVSAALAIWHFYLALR